MKMNELSRLYLLSDYICGVKAVFLCFYCFINPACLSEQFMIMSCRFLQEVISYNLTHVAYKTHRQKSRNTAVILTAGFFFWHWLLFLIINFTSSSLFSSSLMQNAPSFESSLSYFFPQLNATVRIQVQPAAQQAVMPLAAAAIWVVVEAAVPAVPAARAALTILMTWRQHTWLLLLFWISPPAAGRCLRTSPLSLRISVQG